MEEIFLKKIVLYLPNLNAGGAQRVILNLCSYFLEINLNILLLIGVKEGRLKDQIPSKCRIHVLGKARTRNSIIPFIKFCNLNKPDIVLSTLGAAVTIGIAKPFIFYNTKFICRVGNTVSSESLMKKTITQKILFYLANKITFINSDLIICQSEYMKNDVISYLKCSSNKFKVIYNPINISKIHNLCLEDAPQFDLIAIGRLMEQKDYYTLINCIEILVKNNFFIKLGIIGEGHLQTYLFKLVKEKQLCQFITFLGYQSNPYKYLYRSKFLISTSVYEGFSNVIIESLSLGIPVIATDCPSGNREIIKEGYNGFFTNVGSSENMANVIKNAFRQRDNLKMHTIKNNISIFFNISNIGQQYLRVFLNLINN